jgi:hypothetical protein
MTSLRVEKLVFDFPGTVAAEKYDDWQHVNRDWPDRAGRKKVDLVVVQPASAPLTTWMIEAKDFRIITDPPKRSNLEDLPATMAKKVEDTLLGLAATAAQGQVATEKAHAAAAVQAAQRRIVLHLEPHPPGGTHSALFPQKFIADVLQKLKQLVAHIDPKPQVLSIARTPDANVPWTVS